MEITKQKSLPTDSHLDDYRIQKCISVSDEFVTYLAIDQQLELQLIITEYFPSEIVYRMDNGTVHVKEPRRIAEFLDKLNELHKRVKARVSRNDKGVDNVIRFLFFNGTAYVVSKYSTRTDLDRYLSEMNLTIQGSELSGCTGKDSLCQKVTIENSIVFTGFARAGKSTAIRLLSDGDMIDKESGLAYGKLGTGSLEIYLLELSADHFENCLKAEPMGYVLLIDNSRKDPFNHLDYFLDKMDEHRLENVVIGITHTDQSRIPSIPDYHLHLENRSINSRRICPIFSVDPRNRSDVTMLIKALIYSHDPLLSDIFFEDTIL